MTLDKTVAAKLLQKINTRYNYDDHTPRKVFERGPVNCVDSRIEKSRKTRQKIEELKQRRVEIGTPDTMKNISKIQKEFIDLAVEDLETFNHDHQFDSMRFVLAHVDLNSWNHVSEDGKDYLTFNPKMKDDENSRESKYELS